MPKITLLLCIFITGLCFQRCTKTYSVPKEDRPFFEKGDTLVFKSLSGLTDTVLILNVNYWFEAPRSSMFSDRYEYIQTDYSILPNKSHNSIFIRCEQSVDYLFVNGWDLVGSQDQFQLSNGTLISNVKIFRVKPNNVVRGRIDMAYHHPHFGIVKYRYAEVDSVELVLR